MFDIHIKNFEVNVTRTTNVIEARRYLCYFLVDELGIQYNKVSKYIPAITNHATAIHHCKKFKDYLMVEMPTLRNYETFCQTLMGDEYAIVEKEIIVLTNEKNELQRQIRKLKSIIK